MMDGIVGDFPPEDLDPTDIPPIPAVAEGHSLLTWASAEGDLDLLRRLVEGPDSRPRDSDAQAALSVAVQENQLPIVVYLLAQGVATIFEDFVAATKLVSCPILQAFLDAGFDINTAICASYPLPLAITFHDLNLTTWVLQKGADPNARGRFDITPLSIAVQWATLDIIELLFDHGAPVHHGSALSYAVRRQEDDRLGIVQDLLRRGAPVNDILFAHDPISYHNLGLGLRHSTP